MAEPKTAKGRRSLTVALEVLRRFVSTVPARRPSGVLGADYTDSGLVITTEDGRAMHPETLSGLFVRQAKHAGLPPIRLHDLRHSVASILLAQGVHPKVVSEQLGHATHRAHVGHLQPHHSIAATGSRRRHCHCHPRFRFNAASTGAMAEPGAEGSGRSWPVGR
jgi:integrase